MPEGMAEVVRKAKAELERLVTLGQLQGDPLRYPLQGLSVHLDAMLVLSERGGQPIPDQQLREIIRTAARHMEARTFHMAVAANRGLVLGAVAAALMALGVGLGTGWFVWGARLSCAEQAGGRVCYVWTSPPVSAEVRAR